jgi:hypothetical protein
MHRKGLVVIFGLLGIIQAYVISGDLPENAATHFGVSGAANGWMSPAVFFWFMVGMYAIMTAAFTLVPVDMMNIPHKDHWLAGEERQRTLEYIDRNYSTMGLVSQLFLMAVAWLVYDANTAQPPRLNVAFAPIVIGFVGYTLWWTAKFYRRFRR